MEGTSFPFFALRTTDGGAIVFYTMFAEPSRPSRVTKPPAHTEEPAARHSRPGRVQAAAPAGPDPRLTIEFDGGLHPCRYTGRRPSPTPAAARPRASCASSAAAAALTYARRQLGAAGVVPAAEAAGTAGAGQACGRELDATRARIARSATDKVVKVNRSLSQPSPTSRWPDRPARVVLGPGASRSSGGPPRPGGRQHVAGQRRVRGVQVLAHGGPGHRLPAVVARQRDDAVQQLGRSAAGPRGRSTPRAVTIGLARGGPAISTMSSAGKAEDHAGHRAASSSGTPASPSRVPRCRTPRGPGRAAASAAIGGQHAADEVTIDGLGDVQRLAAGCRAASGVPRSTSRRLPAAARSGSAPRPDHVVQRLDLGPERGRPKIVPGRPAQARAISATDAPVSSLTRNTNVVPAGVHHVVDHHGGDDLAVQRVRRRPAGERRAQRRREVAVQLARAATGRPAGPAPSSSRAAAILVYASSTASSGGVRPAPGRRALARSPCRRGRNSSAAVELARPRSSWRRYRACTCSIAGAWAPRPWPAPRSARSCRAAPARRRRRSSRRAARCAPRAVDLAVARRPRSSRILMFTSWSEVSTPAELSMASVLIRPPPRAYSIRPSWVRPRLPPSPTTRQRSCAAVDADRVVGLVADVGVRSRSRP